MRIPSLLPAPLRRRLDGSRKLLAVIRTRLPALAPAEKAALFAIVSVLAGGCLLSAWQRSGVALGPVEDWEGLRALIVRSREDFTRQGGGKGEGKNGGGYPCAVDDIPGFSADPSRHQESILAAGMGFKSGTKTAKAGDGKKGAPARPVDLNTASEKALLSLPGVGPSTAKAILAHRAAHGRFRSVADLLQVKGIGPKKLEALRPYARVEAPPGAPADTTTAPAP